MVFRLFLLLATLMCIVPAADPAHAAQSRLSDESRTCLGCHGNKDFSATLPSGERLSLHVPEGPFEKSVHGAMGCSACHRGISLTSHPSGEMPKDRKALQRKESAVCRTCHTNFKAGIHERLTEGPGARLCIECHNPHSITIVKEKTSKDTEYCLGCHSNRMTLTFRDGTSVQLQINHEDLRNSVHSKLYCSDCHFGFSPDDHPRRDFKSRRDYSLAASESCRRCHFDKYTKTLESIHYAMLSMGRLEAPVCSDCHGAHTIAPAGKERTESAKRCERCHAEIYNTYASSVHGNALFSEHNQDVPVCADCHRAHNIEDPRTFNYREQIPQLCGNCHANRSLMVKYGLSTAVLKSYLQDFHGVTLKLYGKQKALGNQSTLKPIAVCIDCHGIHDITKTTGPDATVVKANLVKRCQKCHPGATEEFPLSWTSHYEPSLKRAPLVFFVNLIYKIFIPFMMAGLILQILLHIWRYAVNR